MLDEYKKEKLGWDRYAQRFLALLEKRRIEETVPREIIDQSCLLCSEDKPHQCHRRLVAEYLSAKWKRTEVVHLG
jgi:uncharacterized protein (DUF488 family)